MQKGVYSSYTHHLIFSLHLHSAAYVILAMWKSVIILMGYMMVVSIAIESTSK